MSLIREVLSLMTAPGVDRLWRGWTDGAVPILMMHRFSPSPGTGPGMPVATLRAQLLELRKRGIRVVSLVEALDALGSGTPIREAVVLTVDDGYLDFHDLALPVFSEFECPVTVFLATGFLDQRTRLWWDTVRVSLEKTGRASETTDRVEALKRVTNDERLRAVAELCREAGVDPLDPATGSDAPMTWDMVRSAATRGVSFGPHTVSHPILSKTSDQQSEFEIVESWRRVQQETDATVPVFCYPNGGASDQGDREYATVRRHGLRAGVSTTPGFATPALVRSAGVLALPRFPHPASMPHLLQLTGGLERLKMSLRHRIS